MEKYVRIGKAAEILGVSVATLRRWESAGEFLPDRRTGAGNRYYLASRLAGTPERKDEETVCYARASAGESGGELDSQLQALEAYCLDRGWSYRLVEDLDPGDGRRGEGLLELLESLARGNMRRLVLTHRGGLSPSYLDPVIDLCEVQGVEVVIIHRGLRRPAGRRRDANGPRLGALSSGLLVGKQ